LEERPQGNGGGGFALIRERWSDFQGSKRKTWRFSFSIPLLNTADDQNVAHHGDQDQEALYGLLPEG
jgi:hypothetical protein